MSSFMGMNGHIWMLKQILRNCPHCAKNCIIDRLISFSIDRNRTCKSCPYFMFWDSRYVHCSRVDLKEVLR